MKNKKQILYFLVFISFFCLLGFFASDVKSVSAASGSFSYTPMEKIPGYETESQGGDFKLYILSVYKFFLWTVGICAMLMIMVGGFMYIFSAGNNASMGKAKGIITDAIIGLIIALLSYAILYKINPKLVEITSLSSSGSSTGGTGSGGGSGGGGGNGSGKCEPVTSGPCSVDELSKNSCWTSSGADLSKISSLCNAESGGRDGRMSDVDKCTNGTPFSCGAMQANMTCLCKGQGAFTGTEPNRGCANKSCTGAGSNYQSCVSQNCYGQGNLNAGCQLYKEHTRTNNKYNTWSKNAECGF